MSKRTPLALIITELDAGGAERCLVNLAIGLREFGFDCRVYGLAGPPTIGKLPELLQAAEVPLEFLGMTSARQFFRCRRKLRERLSLHPPALVQTFLFHANVMGAQAAARLSSRPPIVGGMRVADPSRCRAFLERRAINKMEQLVCVSKSVAEHARSALNLQPAKVSVIPNGIDLSRFPDGHVESVAGRVLFVGRLHPQKGLDEFLPLLPSLFESKPHAHLRLLGDGPQRSELERLSRQYGLADRIQFVGWSSEADREIERAEILVLPSRFEGMPNVVMEAMAAGKPVVATAAEGVEELVGQETDAQVVPLGAYTQLQQKLERLLADSALRARLSEANRDRIEQQFSLERVVEQYARLYHRLLEAS